MYEQHDLCTFKSSLPIGESFFKSVFLHAVSQDPSSDI